MRTIHDIIQAAMAEAAITFPLDLLDAAVDAVMAAALVLRPLSA